MSSSSERSGYLCSEIQTWILVLLRSRMRKDLHIQLKSHHLTHLLTENGHSLALRMVNEPIINKQLVFKWVMTRRKRGGVGTHCMGTRRSRGYAIRTSNKMLQSRQKIPGWASDDGLQHLHKPHRHHHPTGCTQASQFPPGRASENRFLSSHQRTRETIRTHYVAEYIERNSHEQNMISKQFTRILRSEPNFHDVDVACAWMSVMQKVKRRLPNIDLSVTAQGRL